MTVPSIRLRLLVLAAASLIVVLVIAFYAFAATFTDHTHRVLERRLSAELDRLVALVDANSDIPTLRQAMPDARYETPAGGIYWQIRDPATGALARSRSLWDTVLSSGQALPGDGIWLTDSVVGPAGQRVLLVVASLVFERSPGEDRPLEVAVAEDLAETDAANVAFRSDLVRAVAILALALMGTSWATIELGLSPLARIKQGVSRIRSGASNTLAGAFPSEVMPLVTEVNDLLAAQERSIEFARERAADLAHGLKTSLTLLNGEAFALQQGGNEAAAARIEQLTADMSDAIDHQLRLSRLRHRARTDRQSTPLAPVVRKVVAAVRATPNGRELEWSFAVDAGVVVALDAMDLAELCGVVLENAATWAESQVSVSSMLDGERVHLTVSDDGPGLENSALSRLGERGRRLDERGSGTGLGLAIAREIVTLNGGSIEFSRSPEGGLAVQIVVRAGG